MKIWINGCFDVLHIGHIELLSYAASLGTLRVGIDSDTRVKKMKGDYRPINNQLNRKKLLESIKFVDSVVIFENDNQLKEAIMVWEPKYLIVGSDYKNKNVIGSELVEKVLFFDRIDSYSTTNILEKWSK
jgi:D-beta-D-heptose 7-phosphate kinase/D-beta-D-heptose 1-phosphate adenosyltransferase